MRRFMLSGETRMTGLLLAVLAAAVQGQTRDLGNGFLHHGVATPISNHRGTVATVDGQGRNIVLVWLFDHRGGYGLLLIDAETGKSETFPVPFPPGGDCPYASILSSANRYYTHFNSHFVEFDPATRAFTFHHQTAPQMAMSMTEDDNGVIWSASYPQSGIVSFDPKTREFRDYGHVHKENWPQYPRAVAADDAGWIYFGIGMTATQIFALQPGSGKVEAMTPDSERVQGSAQLIRDLNGKVYGRPGGDGDLWYELHKGKAVKIGAKPSISPKPIITDSQSLFHRRFPDGKVMQDCDLVERILTVKDPSTDSVKKVRFDYDSEGAHLMGLAAASDGTICGGTAFPMRFFSYDPKADKWINRAAYGQWNTVARQGDQFFVGGYPGGFLLDWSPARQWVPTEKGNKESNPLFLTEVSPTIHRPHDLLALPDGKTVILAGTPQYGYTGGGLLFWDRETKTRTVLEHSDILPDQATMSFLPLPGGKLLGGGTTTPGTGGEKKAAQADLYIMDLATKKVEWHAPLLPGVQDYSDLCPAPDGLVYGVADRLRFFVFDPAKRELVHEQDLAPTLGRTNSQQGPRIFVLDPKGTIYMLLAKGIARVEPGTFAIHLLAESPVPVGPGGDYLDGRIYFASGSHLYSYTLPKGQSD
ncbi:MAG: hypothetical protein GXY55_11570 [Phycisphaerae bacterium]|mgnify:FL=1|nr:hypothetical protein [Phycisphaerae bacterium]